MVAVAAPVVLFVALRLFPQVDPSFGGGTSHFYVVSAVAALSFALALAVVWAARSVPDPRVTFLALGLLSMAAIFLAHGLGTSPLFASGHAHGEPVEYDYRASWFQASGDGSGTTGVAPGITPAGASDEYGDHGGPRRPARSTRTAPRGFAWSATPRSSALRWQRSSSSSRLSTSAPPASASSRAGIER